MSIEVSKKRNCEQFYDIVFDNNKLKTLNSLSINKIHTGFKYNLDKENDALNINFTKTKNDNDAYIISFELEKSMICTGASIQLELSNWVNINYLAFGLMDGKNYRHVRVVHCRQAHRFILEFSLFDLAWKIQNDYQSVNEFETNMVKLFVKGNPNQDAKVTIFNLCLYKEYHYPTFMFERDNDYKSLQLFNEHWENSLLAKNKIQKVRDTLLEYNSYRNYHEDANYYLKGKGIALARHTQTQVAIFDDLYKSIQYNTTLRYSYHALSQANTLLMIHESTGNIAAILAARDLINEWITDHYNSKTDDMKYCWYDHGVAERLVTLVRLFVLSSKLESDSRFMAKILTIICEHAQLLSSEAFYARNQNYRYHNHALFQDIALLSTSLILEVLEFSNDWKNIAIERMVDQFEHLIYIENQYAVFTENSPSYHAGMTSMVKFIVNMLDDSSDIENLKKFKILLAKMMNFTQVISYPGGKIPAIGDTYRMPNSKETANKYKRIPQELGLFILDKAGYVILNGKNDDVHFKFIMSATNLNKTHKHEDHLSFILFYDGLEWLVDPSFYSHQYKDPFPSYLRSAKAHNNISIENMEYSTDLNVANIKSEDNNNFCQINGEHSAYKDVLIKRYIRCEHNNLNIEGKDLVRTELTDIKCSLLFHCGESIVPKKTTEGIILTSTISEKVLLLTFKNNLEIDIITAQTTPFYCGWTGTGFNKIEESYSVVCNIPKNVDIDWKIIVKGR